MSKKSHFEINVLYNPVLIVFINLLYLIVTTSVIMIIAVSYKIHALIFILIIFWIIPFIFRNKIIAFFGKSAALDFDSNSINVVIYNIKTFEKEKEYSILYSSLKEYAVFNSTKYNAATISLYDIEGKKYSFNLELSKNTGKASNISDAVIDGIKNYNASKNNFDEKINYRPSFLSSKSGKILLMAIGVGWTILTIFILLYKPKISIAVIFGGVFFYITILIQQKEDLRRLKKSQE